MAVIRTNKDILNGSMLMVFINNEPIAFSTSHSINFTTNTTEVSTKCHGTFPSVITQSQSWEIQCENLACADAIDLLFATLNKAKGNTPVSIKFGKPSGWDNKGIVGKDATDWSITGGEVLAYGEALLTSLSINAPANDNTTMSATFTGIGEFTVCGVGASIAGSTGTGTVTGETGPDHATGTTGTTGA